MDARWIEELLQQVRDGSLPVEDAVARLRALPFEDLGFARLDTHRGVRTGFPEVVLCQGKEPEHVREIVARLTQRTHRVIATRATKEVYAEVLSAVPDALYHETARIIEAPGVLPPPKREDSDQDKYILVASAGTADIPVAEEAAVTAQLLGSRVERGYDVGVAGIHRLFALKDHLLNANVIIVVAGMEGALPSVVGGLVGKPVIAVPTSVGYGASFDGLAALLGMLNSCATGVVTVNIDNGFGAGFFAHLINR